MRRSIYKSFQNGYNYLMGNTPSPKEMINIITTTNNDLDNNQKRSSPNSNTLKKETKMIPSTLLLSFFQKVITNLESYPGPSIYTKLLVSNNDYDVVHDKHKNIRVPVQLGVHRQLLLDEQRKYLIETISTHNYNCKTHNADTSKVCNLKDGTCVSGKTSHEDKTITIDQVQECLILLGQNNDFSNIKGCEFQNDTCVQISNTMSKMNNVARCAYVRSVLWAEIEWINQFEEAHYWKPYEVNPTQVQDDKLFVSPSHQTLFLDYAQVQRNLNYKDDAISNRIDVVPMDEKRIERSKILSYCGLCITALKIPQVEQYILKGKDIFSSKSQNPNRNKDTPHQRLLNIQNMILCAVGYEPSYGRLEILKKYTKKVNDEEDEELKSVLFKFITIMQNISNNFELE